MKPGRLFSTSYFENSLDFVPRNGTKPSYMIDNYGHLDLSRWILMDIRCLSISRSRSLSQPNNSLERTGDAAAEAKDD